MKAKKGNPIATKPRKEVNINKDEYIKPKKNTGLKLVRAALWIMIAVCCVKGVIGFLKPDPVSETQSIVNKFIQEQKGISSRDFEVSSFAENFAQEYLTYEAGKIQDYNKRLARYLSKHVAFSETKNFTTTAISGYTKAYKIEQYTKNQFDVYVMSTVDYQIPQQVKNDTQLIETIWKEERKNTYLKVPVKVLGQGQYIVEDFPAFVPAPNGWAYEPTQFEGREVDKTVNKEIEEVLKNFFPAYYEENQTRIDYFLAADADKSNFRGLEGRYNFVKINSLASYADPANPSNIVSLTEIIIEDSIDKQQLTQRFNVFVRRDGERYYIVDMGTKTVDLKYNFSVQ